MRARMGFYERVVFPWLNDLLVDHSGELKKLRLATLASAHGDVVEIGFGTGLSLPFYPRGVRSLTAVEPNEGMLARATDRVAHSPFPMRVIHAPGEELPLEDASFDTATLMLTLCSVDDPLRVLREIRRVLRPGGRLLLLEHGLSPSPRLARWQHRLNPVENLLGAGCNLTRPTAELVRRAGFRFEELREFHDPKIAKLVSWITTGAAVPASTDEAAATDDAAEAAPSTGGVKPAEPDLPR